MARTEEPARVLLALLKDLEIHGVERSFKLFDGTLLWHRFLIGIDRGRIGQRPDETVLGICRRMGMPASLLGAFGERLPEVNFVLFGFEANEKGCAYKVYLEYYDKFPQQARSGPNRYEPFLLHLGFKWDVSDPARNAIAQYVWYPMLPVRNILRRMSDIYDDPRYRPSSEIVQEIVRIASAGTTRKDILYLEVAEGGNPRRSFDINLYEAHLRLRDLDSVLARVCRHYSVSAEMFRPLYQEVADARFGHLAGGIDRQGRDFLTIYYESPMTAA